MIIILPRTTSGIFKKRQKKETDVPYASSQTRSKLPFFPHFPISPTEVSHFSPPRCHRQTGTPPSFFLLSLRLSLPFVAILTHPLPLFSLRYRSFSLSLFISLLFLFFLFQPCAPLLGNGKYENKLKRRCPSARSFAVREIEEKRIFRSSDPRPKEGLTACAFSGFF